MESLPYTLFLEGRRGEMKCDNCNNDSKILFTVKVQTTPNGYGRIMDCCRICCDEFND
jgi:hypothetical protein